MPHRLVFVVCWLAIFAGGLAAFEIEATIKKVDVDKGVVVFTANGTDRTVRLPKDVKVLNAQGKELANGLKAKEPREGAAVTLTVEREDDKPVLKAPAPCPCSLPAAGRIGSILLG